MTSAMAEVIEAWAETGNLLVHKWRDYGADLATGLESGYDAERASAYLGTVVSLSIETGALLMLKTLETVEILNAGLDRRRMEESAELTTQYKGAKLALEGDLRGAFGRTIAADRVSFDPSELGPTDSTFKVCVDVTRCRPGVYDGMVLATVPSNEPEKLPFQIKFPK
jgi:hypothetical protein